MKANIHIDSLATPEAEVPASTPTHRSGFATPYEVLSRLPATATPWQQDSAIRANIHFPEVNWHALPNPMRTPLSHAEEGHLDVTKPLWHARSLVMPDSVYRPEVVVKRQGVAGDPVPYSMASDHLITSLLLVCLLMGSLSLRGSGAVLVRQTKALLHHRMRTDGTMSETSSELRFQVFMVLQTCLLTALSAYLYLRSILGDLLGLEHYEAIGLITGSLAAFITLKAMVQAGVQWVFWDGKRILQYLQFYLLLIGLEGLALFPAVLLMVYFGLPVQSVVSYGVLVVILSKLLSFYKAYLIFFSRERAYVQSFLYFCTLEALPLLALYGIVTMAVADMKVIF